MKERIFPALDEALLDATAFVEEMLEEAECPMRAVMQITVALEEIFVNIAHYAYSDTDDERVVKITVSVENGQAEISFADKGMPFDPLAKKDPDITLSAEERSIGGLGIYMVKKTMDNVRYRYEKGENILTIVKKF